MSPQGVADDVSPEIAIQYAAVLQTWMNNDAPVEQSPYKRRSRRLLDKPQPGIGVLSSGNFRLMLLQSNSKAHKRAWGL
jgi:hypothetical protein